MQTIQIRGFVNVLSPVVHNEILSIPDRDREDAGAAKTQRKLRFILKSLKLQEEQAYIVEDIAVVSGNAVRGLGRRLLYDFTERILNYNLGQVLSAKNARNLLYSLRCGGQTAKGNKPQKSAAEAYYKAQEQIPILDLLGSVFNAHHFEGSTRVGFLVPYLQETAGFFYRGLPKPLQDKHNTAELLSVKEFQAASVAEIRYTRRSETGGAIEDGDKKEATEKESMIYGTEYIPAGTTLVTFDTCHAQNEGTRLAFKAMFALLAQNGIVGGMSGRGHGKVEYELYIKENDQDEPLNIEQAINDYKEYLLANRDEIVAMLEQLPELFQLQAQAAKE